MDDRVKKIQTPEKCEIFAKNCIAKGRMDLANQARQRAVQLKAEAYGAKSAAEKEALEAVYAYEAVLTERNGRTTRASRTWQMIKKHGIIGAVERAVNRPDETQGYKALIDLGLEEYAFEAVILKYPSLFSPEAEKISKERMNERTSS